jgi:hypothetical protein
MNPSTLGDVSISSDLASLLLFAEKPVLNPIDIYYRNNLGKYRDFKQIFYFLTECCYFFFKFKPSFFNFSTFNIIYTVLRLEKY